MQNTALQDDYGPGVTSGKDDVWGSMHLHLPPTLPPAAAVGAAAVGGDTLVEGKGP